MEGRNTVKHYGKVVFPAVAMLACVVILAPVGPALAENMKPLLTRNIENPAREPYEQGLACNLNPAEGTCSVDVTAPSGQVLVIETITARTFVSLGQRAVVLASNLDTGVAHYITLQPQGAFVSGQADALSGTHSIRLYVAPGATLRLTLSRNADTGIAIFQASVSGHLVSCGPGPGCPIPG